MAKARKNKEPAASPGSSGSLLEMAFTRSEAGDVVSARKLAKRLLEGTPSAAEEAAAKRLSPILLAPGPNGAARPTATAAELARLLIERTMVPPKAYIFAAVAGSVFMAMLGLAVTRS